MMEDKSGKSKSPKDKFKVLRVLLNSGSNGDLLFLPKGKYPVAPLKKRIAPKNWRTSNGTFQTTDVGDLEVTFPEFLTSKVATFQPNVV